MRGAGRLQERDLALLEALADFAAIALENARHVKRIHELTITDDCTSLYNARHMDFILETEIYRSQRYGYEFSVVFIDLDHFKNVNDTHGHLIGSKLLAEVGQMVKTACRRIDFAFRYGGDEFVIVLPQASKENAFVVARRLHKLIGETNWLTTEGLDIHFTASIGVASYPSRRQDQSRIAASGRRGDVRRSRTRRAMAWPRQKWASFRPNNVLQLADFHRNTEAFLPHFLDSLPLPC